MLNKVLFILISFHLMACLSAPEGDKMYQEAYRPQYHFSPPAQWMNDPNGMVFYQNTWHLFYQYYPDSTIWGPMHWGHATSRDLLHWKHQDIALYPDSLGYIFSGSAVVDHPNSAGFKTDNQAALVAIFTHHHPESKIQSQSLAISTDGGKQWEKYTHNPVIENPGIDDFRDPKVFYYAPTKQWIMVLAAGQEIKFYASPDLKEWEHLSDFGEGYGGHGGVWECPDLFPLPFDGEEKWVLLVSINPGAPNGGSGTQYFIGHFDGQSFTLDESLEDAYLPDQEGNEQSLWVDLGRDNYAGVSWSDVPEEDGRRIFVGWMSNWDYAEVVPTHPWRSAMTLPRSLLLLPSPHGPRLASQVIEESKSLVSEAYHLRNALETEAFSMSKALPGSAFQLKVEIELQEASGFQFELGNQEGHSLIFGYDRLEDQFFIDRDKAGRVDFSDQFGGVQLAKRHLDQDRIRLEAWFDWSSLELFWDEGINPMTSLFFPEKAFHQFNLFSKDGKIIVHKLEINKVRSIW